VRISVLACILSGVAAICLYACAAHVVASRNQWYRSVHLIFAGLALAAAGHAIAHIGGLYGR
jgi:NADH:ubiquinone oxidoreductase subunit 6 (subunit J)